MLAILPLSALILLLISFRIAVGKDWREASLLAAAGWGVISTVMTEGLSALGALERTAVGAAWSVVNLFLIAALVVIARRRTGGIPRRVEHADPWSPVARVLIGYLVPVVLITAVTALIAPPNMYDLLTYHMSRVVHWIQNRSVDHYPSHSLRQLVMSPWANYAALQFQILTGGDRFAGIVPWLAMLGATAGVSLIARELSATRRVQVWAAIICVSIPSGILQAASGQTDYVAAFWLVCFAWAVLRARTTGARDLSGGLICVLGVSLGLAILTKVTAYFFALPLLVWHCTSQLRERGTRGLPALAAIAAIALALNAGFYARNMRLFGDPLRAKGSATEIAALNEDLGLRTALLGAVRQASLHIGSPSRLGLQSIAERGIRGLHHGLGVDPDDPRLSFRARPFEIPVPTLQDSTGNPLHFALLLAALLLLVVRRRKEAVRLTAHYAVLVAAGFLLFAYLFKWHAASARLHLPIFVLASPAIAIALADLAPRRAGRLGTIILFGLATASLPWLLSAHSRPIIPWRGGGAGRPASILAASRSDLYYRDDMKVKHELAASAALIRSRGCSEVGWISDWNDAEYLVWIALDAPRHARIHHALVTNSSAGAGERSSPDSLCAIIVRRRSTPAGMQLGNRTYGLVLSMGRTSVLMPAAQR